MSNSLREIKEFRHILENSGYAVFFGGAGVSTDSGIPDFRGPNGLYKNKNSSAEYLLSRECLKGEPELFFKFYREKMLKIKLFMLLQLVVLLYLRTTKGHICHVLLKF